MSNPASPILYESAPIRVPLYYGWVNLAIAALAMVATLPGRTIGLAMFTEPILAAIRIDARSYGAMNLWATLIGSTFALACGPLIDRLGARIVLAATLSLLGATVLGMSRVTSAAGLYAALTLTRGFGQSALSAVSIAIIGKSFARRVNVAMAVYAALVAIGFCIAFPLVQFSNTRHGWRAAMGHIGWATLLLAIIGAPLMRSRLDNSPPGTKPDAPATDGWTLRRALRTPAFWVFAIGAACFTLVFSGVSLFSEAILKERGMAGELTTALGVLTLSGLVANFLGGWLLEKWPLGRLMGIGMICTAVALFVLARAATPGMVILFAITMGAAGGMVTVVFFACWPKMFGRRHLGKIQGTAQAMTVLASAGGPWLLAVGQGRGGAFAPLFSIAAPVMAVMGVVAFLVRAPAQVEMLDSDIILP